MASEPRAASKQRSVMARIALGVAALALLAVFSLGAIWWAAKQNLGQLAAAQRTVLERVGADSRTALASIQRSNRAAVKRAERAAELLLRLDLRRSSLAAARTAEAIIKAGRRGQRRALALARLPGVADYLRQLRFGRAGHAFLFDESGPRLVLHQSSELEGRALADEYPLLARHLAKVGWAAKARQARQSGTYLADNRLVELVPLPLAEQRKRVFVITPLAETSVSFAAVADLEGAQQAVLGDVKAALGEAVRASEATNRKLAATIGVLPRALATSTANFERSLLIVSLILLVFCATVVAATLLYFRSGLVHPLRDLSSLAEKIGDGRYDARAVVPRGGAEVQALAASFNAMLDRLVGLIQSDADKQHLEADVMALLQLVSRAAEGDLSVRAEVSSAEMGSVTDALNHMLESIGHLVLKVRGAGAGVSDSAARIFAASEAMSRGANEQAALIDDVTRKIRALGERSLEINRIVVLVEEIAAQTNVLALNAAIEASRGGGAARGFAIVAEEVRKLADRSSNATKDIGAFIETIHQATNDSVETMEDIRRVTRGTVAGVQDTTRAATEMVQDTRELEESISRFRVRGVEAQELAQTLGKRHEEVREGIASLIELTRVARTAGPEAQSAAHRLLTDLRLQLTRATDGPGGSPGPEASSTGNP